MLLTNPDESVNDQNMVLIDELPVDDINSN